MPFIAFIVVALIVFWIVKTYWKIILAIALSIFAMAVVVIFAAHMFHKIEERFKKEVKDEEKDGDLQSQFDRFSKKKIPYWTLNIIDDWVFLVLSFVVPFFIMSIIDVLCRIYLLPRFGIDPFFGIWSYAVIAVLACGLSALSYRPYINHFSYIHGCSTKVVASYKELLKLAYQARGAEEALEHAPSLRRAAKRDFSSPYRIFCSIYSYRNYLDSSGVYGSKRLGDLLLFLEKFFPHDHDDENFRRRYWNYAQHVRNVLEYRGYPISEESIFNKPYCESQGVKQARIVDERRRRKSQYENDVEEIWSKDEALLTQGDALRVLGLIEVPPGDILDMLEKEKCDEYANDRSKLQRIPHLFSLMKPKEKKANYSFTDYGFSDRNWRVKSNRKTKKPLFDR